MIKPAEKIAVGSEGAAEGGCGGNSAAPEPKRSPAALPEALRAESSKNIFFPLIEKNFRGRAKSKIVEKMFLLGLRALRAAAGRSVSSVQNRFGFGQINAPYCVCNHTNFLDMTKRSELEIKQWMGLFQEVSYFHWKLNVLPVWERYENGKLPWQSVAIFLSTYAFETGGGVNPNFAPVAEDTIKEKMKETEKINQNLESEVWEIFKRKMRYGDKEKNYGGLKHRGNPLSPYSKKSEQDKDGKSLIARMREEKIINLIDYVRMCLQNDEIDKAFTFLDSVRGVGVKISSFFLRDVNEKYGNEPTKKRELLQPIDVWVRRIVLELFRGWPLKDEYDNHFNTEIARWIVDEAIKGKYNPERINMGMWYFGSNVCGKSKYKFDILFRNFATAKKVWEEYCKKIQGICRKELLRT